MLRSTLTGMWQRKLRLFLSGVAVVLGVMFVAGSFVLTDTLGRSFDRVFADAFAYVDVRVAGESALSEGEFEGGNAPVPIPGDTVAAVAAVPGVADADGVVEVDGVGLVGADGEVVGSFGPPRLGVNWRGENGLVELREGRGPTAPDEIAVNAELAASAGVEVGDRVGVLTLEPEQTFTLVGVFGYAGDRGSLGGAQEVAFTDGTAARLMLGEPGVWTAVDVTAADGVAPDRLRDDIAAALGDGYRVSTGAQLAAEQADQLKEGLTFLSTVLLGFAGVALFVGVFLILNTFSIIVAQRTGELALTRALGASRRQVVGSVLLEALLIGAVASVVGLAAGLGVGALLTWLAAEFASLPTVGLTVPATAVLAALGTGLPVTMLAALLPALRAARVPPVAALREAATPDRPLTRLTVAGAVVTAAGAGLLGWGVTVDAPAPAGVGGLGVLIGAALLSPVVARPVAATLGRVFAWSVPGVLGRLNAGRNPRRTAITAAALMIGVALVSGVNLLLESARVSIERYVDDNIQAELVITGESTGPRPPSFDPAVVRQARELPGVRAAAGVYNGRALVDGEETFVNAATDLAQLADIHGAKASSGALVTLHDDQLALDDTAARRHDVTVGDRLTVRFSDGDEHRLTVAAVYPEGDLPGRYMLPPELTTGLAVPKPYLGMVDLRPGTPTDGVREQLSALLAASPEVGVTDISGFVEQQSAQLDTVLTVIQVLLAMAILIAVLGIVNTLALSVLERTRELGLLRSVGLSRGGTVRMVTVEAVVISLFGALLGLVVGSGLGVAVARALREQGITDVAVPWADFGTYLLLAGLVGVVAAVAPAVRAARVDVLRAIAHE